MNTREALQKAGFRGDGSAPHPFPRIQVEVVPPPPPKKQSRFWLFAFVFIALLGVCVMVRAPYWVALLISPLAFVVVKQRV